MPITPSNRSYSAIIRTLKSLGNARNVEGMARYGIVSARVFGVSAPALRALAKRIGTDHALAQRLWQSGIHDARILAALIDDAELVSKRQMEQWVKDFDNWAVCDACCGNLFDRAPNAFQIAVEWSKRREEFVKRAGYVLMAELAVHNKHAEEKRYLRFFPHIRRGARDHRNFVKKAVNWALRQIGKRNLSLNRKAMKVAKEIAALGTSASRWIAADALRELRSRAVQRRLRKKMKTLV